MIKDIGGYLEFEKYNGMEYHSKAVKLNTARNCLKYLIEVNNIKTIFIPKYVCNSVIDACDSMNCKYQFYNIDESLKPILKCNSDDFVYIINYFGILENNYLKELCKKYKNIIIDNVQDFFRKPIENVDTIYSCRKFFGVTDGAYLYTKNKLKRNLEYDKSSSRIKYLFERFEEGASKYYQEYVDNENCLDKLPLQYMSLITENFMKSFNYKDICYKRSENFKYLNKYLKNTNKLQLSNIIGAYMYPYYVSNGKKLKNDLISNNIYVPTLWPNVIESRKNTLEYDYAENIVFLPVDQRYNKKDMQKIIKIIKSEE